MPSFLKSLPKLLDQVPISLKPLLGLSPVRKAASDRRKPTSRPQPPLSTPSGPCWSLAGDLSLCVASRHAIPEALRQDKSPMAYGMLHPFFIAALGAMF